MESIPPIFIKAINPGYSVDGQTNVGEFVELSRPLSDIPFLLTNILLRYTNSSGNAVTLFAFPEGSLMAGENLLLRFAGSPDSELANATYAKTLAMSAGPLELIMNGEVIDSVCWHSKADCLAPFNSSNPTILVRDDNMIFTHQTAYLPTYHTDALQTITQDSPPTTSTSPAPHCQGLQFSEIFTFYQTDSSEQFIEFFNSTASPIDLAGCTIKYKNNTHSLSGTVAAQSYFVYSPDFSLTKNPTTTNTIELFDADGSPIDALIYGGQKKLRSFAKIMQNGTPTWQLTYAITKGSANILQQYQTCEEGKIINEATGHCVKAPTPTVAKTCAEGYFLNPATNRCKKLPTNTGTTYALATLSPAESSESFIALYTVIVILLIGCIYIILQFRVELKQLFGKVFRRSH